MDERLDRYARLLVERCLDVQPGWEVLVFGQPLGRPLVEAVVRHIARRGAYAHLRLGFEGFRSTTWLKEAPEELLDRVPSITAFEFDNADAYAAVIAPENTRDGSDVPAERLGRLQKALRPHTLPFLSDEKPWVGCQYPTPALAQDAGMTLPQFEEFLYGAVLIDWDELRHRMEQIAERFDAAREVRVVGAGTDLTFSLDGRKAMVDALGANMPGGEIFYSPVEDSAEGVIHYSEYPACLQGHQVPGVRFRFEGGRIVEASADSDEEYLLTTLDTDDGARRLGEFGIGCNPGIQRHMRNTLFDEKMDGTVHFAIGQSFPHLGGRNTSAVHWDMVKDLRRGGELYLDGDLVQKDGAWLI